MKHNLKLRLYWACQALFIVLFIYFAVITIAKPHVLRWTSHFAFWWPFTTYIVFWEGRRYFVIYRRLLRGVLDMDLLVGFSAHALYIYSTVMVLMHLYAPLYSYPQMWEGAGILVVVTNVGHAIENALRQSTTAAYEALDVMRNAPTQVVRDKQLVTVKASAINVGERFMVLQGEMVPLDGTVQSDAVFNYANITGEARDVMVLAGSQVMSGAYNVGQNMTIVATKVYDESTIANVVRAIEEVSAAKPPLQRFADAILRRFIPFVLGFALLALIFWLIIAYAAHINVPWVKGEGYELAISGWIAVMAIACPCALGIATPLIYAATSITAMENGVMVNNPVALEKLPQATVFVFDKTGTLTSDVLTLVNITGEEKYLPVAKGLELNVNHAIARSIMALPGLTADVTNIHQERTQITGLWEGKEVRIGAMPTTTATTAIVLSVAGREVMTMHFANELRPGASSVINALRRKKKKVIMITGDHEYVAQSVADNLGGVDAVFSNVSPEGKAAIIREWQARGEVVAFVGDGFNDAVSVRQADIALAFSSGSGITNALSDISLLDHRFSVISKVWQMSKMNSRAVRLSLAYAFAFNLAALPVAFLLLVQPWMGAAIMAVSDILVAVNAYWYRQRVKRKLAD